MLKKNPASKARNFRIILILILCCNLLMLTNGCGYSTEKKDSKDSNMSTKKSASETTTQKETTNRKSILGDVKLENGREEEALREVLIRFKKELGPKWTEYIDYLGYHKDNYNHGTVSAIGGEIAIRCVFGNSNQKLTSIRLDLVDAGGLMEKERKQIMISLMNIVTPNISKEEKDEILERLVHQATNSMYHTAEIAVEEGGKTVLYTVEAKMVPFISGVYYPFVSLEASYQ